MMQQLTQTLRCLECSRQFAVTDELFQHQQATGHMDFECHSIFTFRAPRALVVPRLGTS